MKKLFLTLIVLALAVFSAACSDSASGDEKTKTVKLGVSGTDTRIWDYVAEKAEKEGIEIEIVTFNDYVQPNLALAEGELDANAFQTVSYFDAFIKEHNLDLEPIATTVIAPMGVYSDKYKDVAEIPEGGKIALANEATNMGRGLLLLQEAGLIKLEDNFNGIGSLDKIVENPKNLEFVPMVAGQTPRVMPDVAASVINNGVAVDAGLTPKKDATFLESETATPYINIIAVRGEDTEDETLKRVAELYQEEDTAEFIDKEYKGNMLPTFVPLSKIGW